jgi:hypothetical protein
VREIARITDGSYYQVLAWDKRSDTIAAVVIPHAQPASTYVVIGPSGTKTFPLDGGWGMYGSPDAQSVVGIHCAGSPDGCSFWTWPLADFAARKDQHFPAGLSLGVFGWRPGSSDVGLSVSDLGTFANTHLELWSPSAGRRTAYRFTGGLSLPSQPFFRADGSAIFLPGYGEGVVVDLSTDATSPLPFPEPTGPYERALPEASIRLDEP